MGDVIFFPFLFFLLLYLSRVRGQAVVETDLFLQQFDIETQKAALERLREELVKKNSSLLVQTTGEPGNLPWNTPNTSYCNWWGVTCCGVDLNELRDICTHGVQSIVALQLQSVDLAGTLPDVFRALPDLQLLDLSSNRGIEGFLPPSLGALPALWILDAQQTGMRCGGGSGSTSARCPLPDWVRELDQFSYAGGGKDCPGLTFILARENEVVLSQVYTGTTEPVVQLDPKYYNYSLCINSSLPVAAPPPAALPPWALIIVITLPALAVAAGLVLVAIVLLRYVRQLKASHDAIHLTEAWKRRHPPGLVSEATAQVYREVTLAVTDVEGSTELWEWDYTIMTQAQEVHDSIVRALISRYCGYEVTTEGDSFTIAFHEPADAACWALHLQTALLEAAWPPRLLDHPRAREERSTAHNSAAPGAVLYRGLRVRVALSTGIPTSITTHELTNTLQYIGPVVDVLAAIGDLPAGGTVLMAPNTSAVVCARLPEMGSRLQAEGGAGPTGGKGDAAGGGGGSVWRRRRRWSARGRTPSGMRGVPSGVRALVSLDDGSQQLAAGNGFARRSLLGILGVAGSGGSASSASPAEVAVAVVAGGGAAAPPPPQEAASTPLVLDMGSHWLEAAMEAASLGMGSMTAAGSFARGVRLAQLVTRHLSPRAAVVRGLASPHQLSPSYWDAPSSGCALLPDGLLFDAAELPRVVLAFAAPDAVKALRPPIAHDALIAFCAEVRATLAACSGYECQEKDGIFMVAFGDAGSALEWACLLQLALLRLPWPPALLACPGCGEVVDPETGELLFRGLRARVGVYEGPVTRIIPHRSTGRADYFGPCVNRAARLLAAATPGQVLVEAELAQGVLGRWKALEADVAAAARAPQYLTVYSAGRARMTPCSSGSTVHSASRGPTSTAWAAAAAATDEARAPPAPRAPLGEGRGEPPPAAGTAAASARSVRHYQPLYVPPEAGAAAAYAAAEAPPPALTPASTSTAGAAPPSVAGSDAPHWPLLGGGYAEAAAAALADASQLSSPVLSLHSGTLPIASTSSLPPLASGGGAGADAPPPADTGALDGAPAGAGSAALAALPPSRSVSAGGASTRSFSFGASGGEGGEDAVDGPAPPPEPPVSAGAQRVGPPHGAPPPADATPPVPSPHAPSSGGDAPARPPPPPPPPAAGEGLGAAGAAASEAAASQAALLRQFASSAKWQRSVSGISNSSAPLVDVPELAALGVAPAERQEPRSALDGQESLSSPFATQDSNLWPDEPPTSAAAAAGRPRTPPGSVGGALWRLPPRMQGSARSAAVLGQRAPTLAALKRPLGPSRSFVVAGMGMGEEVYAGFDDASDVDARSGSSGSSAAELASLGPPASDPGDGRTPLAGRRARRRSSGGGGGGGDATSAAHPAASGAPWAPLLRTAQSYTGGGDAPPARGRRASGDGAGEAAPAARAGQWGSQTMSRATLLAAGGRSLGRRAPPQARDPPPRPGAPQPPSPPGRRGPTAALAAGEPPAPLAGGRAPSGGSSLPAAPGTAGPAARASPPVSLELSAPLPDSRRSFLLAALHDAVHRAPAARVPVSVQVHSLGVWSLKGISEAVEVVQVLPTCLQRRRSLQGAQQSSRKATCVRPGSGLLAEVAVALPDTEHGEGGARSEAGGAWRGEQMAPRHPGVQQRGEHGEGGAA